MNTTKATHLFTPDELQQHIEEAQAEFSQDMLLQLAQAKALAEIAYQLSKLNGMLETAVDQRNGCFVTRRTES